MSTGLPVSRLINATVNLAPNAASFPNINSLLILGDSAVINTLERIRSYATLAAVGADFGTTAPEYLAASLYFGQAPQPTQLYIGRAALTATKGLAYGRALTTAQQALANFTSITAGGFKVAIDGAAASAVTALNFSAATSLAGVAATITAAMTGATCAWDGSHFVITSSSTGATSTIAAPIAPASGVDARAALGLDSGVTTVNGIVAETPLAAFNILDGMQTYFYGAAFAAATAITDDQYVAVAGAVEASGNRHILFVTTSAAAAYDPLSTTDLAYRLKALAYKRTWTQYNAANPYAAVSAAGRILTVNFNGNNTVINLMYKVEPGVTSDTLSTTQADAIAAKYANIYVNYNNSTAIIQYGRMASGDYIDEIYGLDFAALRIQTDVYNLLYTSLTKIPQTDRGMAQIATVIEAACQVCVDNGLFAPGVWTSGGVGQIATGDTLSKGFYVYCPPISSQSSGDRALRKSVPFQVLAKLAGAVNTVDVAILVNR